MKIYIIASMKQYEEVKELKDKLKGEVRYVKPESKPLTSLIKQCFDNIEWADKIIVIRKPNGTNGHGVLYEVEYAKRCNKEIEYVWNVVK